MSSATTNPFDASGSALGYLYQCERALVTFLRRLEPGEAVDVAIEKLDDISFEKAGTPLELIQTKHHVGARASLTDMSPDLWKSLRVWVEAFGRQDIRLPGVLLTLMTTSAAPAGSIAASLRPATGRDTVEACARLVKVATTSHSKENEDAYAAFTSLTPSQRAVVVDSIYVMDGESGAADVTAEITRLVQHAADDAHLAAFVERLRGWWIERVVEHLVGAVPGPIRGADIRLKLTDLRHSFQPDNLPLDFVIAEPPNGTDPEGDMRVFVHQLRIIAANNDRIRFAITDYFRAYAQRSRWLREDLVHAGELEAYEHRLIEELDRHSATARDDVSALNSEAEKAAFGRRMLSWVENVAHVPIRERVAGPFVMRGSYHLLADQSRVGWHPDFLERLRGLLSSTPAVRP